MLSVLRMTDRSQEAEIHELVSEYFTWVSAQLQAEFAINLNTEAIIANDFANLEMYFPPYGGLFLAKYDNVTAGMIFLTQLRSGVGQLRRMYVRPTQRRHGIGKVLCETAIHTARAIGYDSLLLESPISWAGAHALYHSLGFEAIPMYPEGEVREDLRQYWVFMQLKL